MRPRLAVAALAMAVTAAVLLIVLPAYSGFVGDHPSHATLIQVNGAWALVPILFPVLIALMPVILPRRRVQVAATVLLACFVVIGGFSIGLFYLPSAALMLIGTCATTRRTVAH